VTSEVFDPGNWRRLIDLVMRRLGDFGGHQFRHALDVDRGAGFASAVGNSLRHGFDVTVSGIIEDENFCHDGSPRGEFQCECWGQGRHGRDEARPWRAWALRRVYEHQFGM